MKSGVPQPHAAVESETLAGGVGQGVGQSEVSGGGCVSQGGAVCEDHMLQVNGLHLVEAAVLHGTGPEAPHDEKARPQQHVLRSVGPVALLRGTDKRRFM